MKTKKLISNLKKEIEIDKKCLPEDKCKKCENSWKGRHLDRKQAQLQFAEKLIKAIKKDINNSSIEGIWRDKAEEINLKNTIHSFKQELNKILDEAIEK